MLRRRLRPMLVLSFAAVAVFVFFTLRLDQADLIPSSDSVPYTFAVSDGLRSHTRRVSSLKDDRPSSRTVAVLLPDWDVLVLVLADHHRRREASFCLFQNNATSPATFSARLPSANRTAFKCSMPNSVRRLRPFYMPLLVDHHLPPPPLGPSPELYRWTFLVYDSLATETDVVLFVKGVNHRQGMSRPPADFTCVFFLGGGGAVRTPVTSSSQEVFRCGAPDLTAVGSWVEIGVSLEIKSEKNLVVPSVAQYVPRRSVAAAAGEKKEVCASAMVYNGAKFVREWVTYHSRVGVEKFLVYDNDSSDNLSDVVSELKAEGLDVSRRFWIWPKTQEAGFSHAAVQGKEWCTWMMYVDVDEFVFSPSWAHSPRPSTQMLKSLLSPKPTGQVSIGCNEFGPSNQRAHPAEGVTQGYTCRRAVEQRHKSIVLLEAVDPCLVNVVHHFRLRPNYVTKRVKMERAIVNHYKYQAWAEFRNKFRRRVSTYVVDWTQRSNMASNDRTPGLGFHPVEPLGWGRKFCEVRDHRLSFITRTWFATPTPHGYNMPWQT